jgi:putative spermidine/putrescine transport system permease protein
VVTPRSSTFFANTAPLLLAGLVLGVPLLAGMGYLVLGATGVVGSAAPVSVASMLADPIVLRSLLLSIWIAVCGTLLTLMIAISIVLLFDRRAPLDRLTRAVTLLPLPIPTVAAAVTMLLMLSQSGWLSRVSHALAQTAQPADFPALVYDPWAIGVIAAIVWKEVPFLVLVGLSLQALRGAALTDTARTLGASPWMAIRRVTLPMLLRGLAPSAIAVGVFVFGSLELPMLLGSSAPMALPMLIQERRASLDAIGRGEAYVIALIATVLALCAVVVHEWLRGDEQL